MRFEVVNGEVCLVYGGDFLTVKHLAERMAGWAPEALLQEWADGSLAYTAEALERAAAEIRQFCRQVAADGGAVRIALPPGKKGVP